MFINVSLSRSAAVVPGGAAVAVAVIVVNVVVGVDAMRAVPVVAVVVFVGVDAMFGVVVFVVVVAAGVDAMKCHSASSSQGFPLGYDAFLCVVMFNDSTMKRLYRTRVNLIT